MNVRRGGLAEIQIKENSHGKGPKNLWEKTRDKEEGKMKEKPKEQEKDKRRQGQELLDVVQGKDVAACGESR